MKTTGFTRIAGWISIVGAVSSLLLLAILHIVSPEFDPSWRMISEYADGKHAGLLFAFFVLWGLSSLALVATLRTFIKTRGGKIGLLLLAVAGIGQVMAGIFDINHPLHDLAGNIAIPAFAIAALLVTRSLRKNTVWKQSVHPLVILAHASWISVVLLVVSFIVLIATYTASGAPASEGTEITTLPEGIIALVGWTNRLLVVVFAFWAMVAAYLAIKK